jgi:hypothetical protein
MLSKKEIYKSFTDHRDNQKLHGTVLVKRVKPYPENTNRMGYGYWPDGSYGQLTHQQMYLREAVQLILDYLGVKYEDGQPAALVRGTNDGKKKSKSRRLIATRGN